MKKTYTITLDLTDTELLTITGNLYIRIAKLEKERAEYGAEWCSARGKQAELEICRQTYEKIHAAVKAEKGEHTMKKYEVMRMFADGVLRKRTLTELAREIERDNPEEIVEIISETSGRVWCGRAKNITADLTERYRKHCVQEISIDEYGITLVMP